MPHNTSSLESGEPETQAMLPHLSIDHQRALIRHQKRIVRYMDRLKELMDKPLETPQQKRNWTLVYNKHQRAINAYFRFCDAYAIPVVDC